MFEHFPFVRKGQSDYSRHCGNFTFNQNYPARSVNSSIICIMHGVGGFMVKALRKAIFRYLKKPLQLASSDFG